MTTSIITIEGDVLTQTTPPALPHAPDQYSRQYHDQMNNVLRLYFNTLNNFLSQLTVGPVCLVAELPVTAATSVGARAFVTDSSVTTFNTVVAGGGANKVPVFFDGTDWKVG